MLLYFDTCNRNITLEEKFCRECNFETFNSLLGIDINVLLFIVIQEMSIRHITKKQRKFIEKNKKIKTIGGIITHALTCACMY